MSAKIAYDAITLARIPKIINEPGAPALPPPDLSGDPGMQSGEDTPQTAGRLDPGASRFAFTSITRLPAPTPKCSSTWKTAGSGRRGHDLLPRLLQVALESRRFREGRARTGQLGGVKAAEHFNVRLSHLKARDYLD